MQWWFSLGVSIPQLPLQTVFDSRFKVSSSRALLRWNITKAPTFDVRLIKNGKVVETVEDVYLDSLVNVIDYRVEKVDNYKQRVIKTYSIGI